MLLKVLKPKIVVHADFRKEIKVNPTLNEMFENSVMESEEIFRAKKMAGRFSVIRTFHSASPLD